MRPPHSTRHQPGFTLIELLVVISIISLLVAILLPALASARKAAQQTQCQANLRSIGMSAIMYDQDFTELPGGSGTGRAQNRLSSTALVALKQSYGLIGKFWQCPYTDPWDRGVATAGGNMTYDWMAGRGDYTGTGNPNINGWRTNAGRWSGSASGWYPQLSTVKPDSNAVTPIMMLDFVANYPTPNTNVTVPQRSNHMRVDDGKADGVNALYLDVHVEWQKFETNVAWRLASGAYNSLWWSPRSGKYQPYAGTLLWP